MAETSALVAAVATAPFGLAFIDGSGRWHSANGRAAAVVGARPGTLVAPAGLLDTVHIEDRATVADAIASLRDGLRNEATIDCRFVHESGHVSWVEVRLWWVEAGPEGIDPVIACQLQDVSGRREVEERYRCALRDAPIGTVLCTPGGLWLEVNRALCEMLGRTEGELLGGTSFTDVLHPDDRDRVFELFASSLDSSPEPGRVEARLVAPDGRIVWTDMTVSLVRRPDGLPFYLIVQIQDVTERLEQAEQLRDMALHDPLTGLANRILLSDRIEQARHRTVRSGRAMAVLYCDVDDFKAINDTLGHKVGDEFLTELARRIQMVLRPSDTVARVGGDEFVVVCDGLEEPDQALMMADRVGEAVDREMTIDEVPLRRTVSIGVVTVEGGDTTEHSAETLLRDADTALYAAKRDGRARHAVFTEELRHRTVHRHRLENELRVAVEDQAFTLHHQPVVDLATGAVVGFEALLRWFHPDRGLLGPTDFLDVAEESPPFMVELGESVLRLACRDLRVLRRRFGEHVWVAVNVSGHQLGEPRFAETAARVLEEEGASGSGVHIELTESILVRSDGSAIADLREVRALGLRVAIDDFGTGWSSLSYLRCLPVDHLKIDRAFVANLSDGGEKIPKAIVQMADALALDTVAEGIEALEQVDVLLGIGCRRGQGFFLGPPAPVDQVQVEPQVAAQLSHLAASHGLAGS
ncbi:MAG: EAL domain-containing protein [Actinomycetota bacterium]|nr:EAL domain-containing protein [Actinomycetota bacterium]